MKKWFVCLLVLLALVLASSTAMALVVDGACGVCQAFREFEQTNEYVADPNGNGHIRIYRCTTCGRNEGMRGLLPHTTSKAATCISQAYCDLCKSYFGDKAPDNHAYTIVYNKDDEVYHIKEEACSRCRKINYTLTEKHTPKEAATCMSAAICAVCNAAYGSPNPNAHNWSDWQPNLFNSNLHYRYCMNIGCSASESESHDGNSNCVTSATCSKCHATYKDTTKHEGPFKYSYNKYDESFHKRIETCTACGNKTGNEVTTKHEESTPAECTHAAWCNVCNQAYGDPNPDNHRWGNWTYENENLHYRICSHNESHIQHADHRGYATCIDSMPCLDCDCSYKDPDKHQGGTDFDYTNVSDTEHKVTVICGGCHGEIKTYQEGHSEHTPATCSSRAICAKCSTPFGDLAPNNHIGEATTTYVKTSETQHTPTTTYSDCPHSVTGAPVDHTAATPATCIAAAYCETCRSYYGSANPNAHRLVSHSAKAATCTEIGWNAYVTCARCDYTTYAEIPALDHKTVSHTAKAATCTEIGWNAYDTCARCDYSTYAEIPALGHRYGEWTPNADGTHAESCLRGCGYEGTADCTLYVSALSVDGARMELTICPVCGEIGEIRRLDANGALMETLGGTVIALAEDAAASALTERLPGGELAVRMGALPSGELLMSVAFELAGEPTQPTGLVKITLPADLLDGYALSLIDEDGTEVPLDLDVQKDTASFALDFTDSQLPARLLRLVPMA